MPRESHLLKHERDRTESFLPNPKLIERIEQLRSVLQPLHKEMSEQFLAPRLPVVVVVGCPRSGTTVLTQLLAATTQFAYPTNVLSRFAYAPMLGAMIQQMLFDPEYDFCSEMADIQKESGFSSSIGKTSGAMGLSEFFHFWRRFFPTHDIGYLTEEELACVDIAQMRKELAAIESVFGKPFMSKGMMMQYNIGYFAKRMPELFFLHIKREPRFQLQSVMQARRKYYRSDSIWWSVKPREYDRLATMDMTHQVAGQVWYTVKSMEEELNKLPDTQKLVCGYEDFCARPKKVYDELRSRLAMRGHLMGEYTLDHSLTCANESRLPEKDLLALETAYEKFRSEAEQKGGRT